MTGSQWSELMRCTDAEPVASFLDARGNDALVDRVLDESGVEPVADVPAGVEVVRRRGGDRSWLFVINHGDDKVEVRTRGHDLVGDRPVDGLRLGAGGVAVVREE